MALTEIYNNQTELLQKSIEALKKDFMTLRSGKVSTAVVENVKINYYDTMTPLTQVGSVLATDATTITISPWEKNLLHDIEKLSKKQTSVLIQTMMVKLSNFSFHL